MFSTGIMVPMSTLRYAQGMGLLPSAAEISTSFPQGLWKAWSCRDEIVSREKRVGIERGKKGQGLKLNRVKFFAKPLELNAFLAKGALRHVGNENRRLAFSVVRLAIVSIGAFRIAAIASTTLATNAGSFRVPRCGWGAR